MINLGRINQLRVTEINDEGAWLEANRDRVLLPNAEIKNNVAIGDDITVFVYADASGTPTATLNRPIAQVGEFALMPAGHVNQHGAFMKWGLDKDLLVPSKEQLEPMKKGMSYVVKVRLDRKGRPIGTGRIDKCLSGPDETIADGQKVDLIVYKFTHLGAKVIINHRFSGLLYRNEIGHRLQYGDQLSGYVSRIRPDGKIDCSLSLGSQGDVDDAKAIILKRLHQNHGFLPLHDKSSPKDIQETLGLSKKLFKKGIGGLYKSGVIELADDGVRLKN